MPYSFRLILRALCSAQYHRQHCTLQAFEQFGALYICTAPFTNIRIRTQYLVRFEPQPDRMSHQGLAGTHGSLSETLHYRPTAVNHGNIKYIHIEIQHENIVTFF